MQAAPTLKITQNHAALRAEIARLDQDVWVRRNANHLSPHAYRQIDRLERRAARLTAHLPEASAEKDIRPPETQSQRATFARGLALYEKRQAVPLHHALEALAGLTDPALPPALHRQIAQLLTALEKYDTNMRNFDPNTGIPDEMRALLPFPER